MKLRSRYDEPPREASSIDGVIARHELQATSMGGDPYHEIRLLNDDREYILYGGGWTEFLPGASVTLHSFEGFKTPHDDGPNNFYLDGIEVKTESGQVVTRVKRALDFVFEN